MLSVGSRAGRLARPFSFPVPLLFNVNDRGLTNRQGSWFKLDFDTDTGACVHVCMNAIKCICTHCFREDVVLGLTQNMWWKRVSLD